MIKVLGTLIKTLFTKSLIPSSRWASSPSPTTWPAREGDGDAEQPELGNICAEHEEELDILLGT